MIRAWLCVCLMLAASAHAGERWCSDKGVCVEVDDQHEIRVVRKDMPKFCVSVEGWDLKTVKPDACEDELVVSPSLPCAD